MGASGSTTAVGEFPADESVEHDADVELYPEQIVAENIGEAIWLRFRRLTSPTLCKRMILARAPELASNIAMQKGQEVASSVRSALGYWQSQPNSLNSKILSRYYAILQVSIAEQVADPASAADLLQIQSHTESGHGLWTIATPEGEFPANRIIACQNRGHFYNYCLYKGIDLTPYTVGARPDSWEKLSGEKKLRVVTLADMFRRVPELQLLIEETLGVQSLSFRIGYDSRNFEIISERRQAYLQRTGQFMVDPPREEGPVTTFIGIYPHGQKFSVEYLNSLELPFTNIREAESTGFRKDSIFLADLQHPSGTNWHDNIETYKSGYCGTSIISPVWGIRDIFIIHFAILYTLSIVVRYLPSLWHEIEDGELDHIRALIEQYLAIVDNVLPVISIQRITGRKLIPVQPGSLHGPT